MVLNRSKLDELAELHGLATDADLERALGTTHVTLWRISTGRVYPSSEFIARVVHAFPDADIKTVFSKVVLPPKSTKAAA